jgi:hypothetical protein
MTIFTDNFETVTRNVKMGGVKSLDFVFNWKALFNWSLPFWCYRIEIETPQF